MKPVVESTNESEHNHKIQKQFNFLSFILPKIIKQMGSLCCLKPLKLFPRGRVLQWPGRELGIYSRVMMLALGSTFHRAERKDTRRSRHQKKGGLEPTAGKDCWNWVLEGVYMKAESWSEGAVRSWDGAVAMGCCLGREKVQAVAQRWAVRTVWGGQGTKDQGLKGFTFVEIKKALI